MKKIIFIIMILFLGISNVLANEKIQIELVSVLEDSVTLEVKLSDSNKDSYCYLYRSTDGIDYDNKMIVDCNKMYVDNGLEIGKYYYKARYGNDDLYSNILEVEVIDNNSGLLLTRDVNNISKKGIEFMIAFGIFSIILVAGMFLFKKNLI